ncbi:MAG: hypothetical protein EB011_00935 [Actinobacteria bacterium]|nr:hypothetical protein [Actinomycetota bacterium]
MDPNSINFISRRALILGTVATALSGTAIGRAIGAVTPAFNQIIGSPTNEGIVIQLLANQKMNLYIELGYSKTVFPVKTAKIDVEVGAPTNISATGLKSNSRVYYRIRYKTTSANTYQISKVFSFMTQRSANSTFSFTVQGDTHPERAGKMFNAELYGVTLANIKSQAPDFHILLGDDFDPYWNSKNPVDNVAGDTVGDDQSAAAKNTNKKNAAPATGGGNGKTSNLWSIGLGDQQYFWFKETLEKSKAKYKFVFAHHVMGTGRGAIEVSENYEWGGKDPKGQTTFQKERPNWELPIHDLMVKNGVSIFFQGHDHIFVTQERDGLIYQSMPNPADDTFSYFNDAAYKSGTKAPNSGHVRVTVAPSGAKVEYFLAARTKDASRKNMQVAHTYTVKAK